MKYFFVIPWLLCPFTAAIGGPRAFQISGVYCANPWDGHEGPDHGASQRAADRKASESCYPFQALRESEYVDEAFAGCKMHFWGSRATATYSCAGPGATQNGAVAICE